MDKEQKIGCAAISYLILSYPANWIFLKFVMIPAELHRGIIMDFDSKSLMLIFSPVLLPMEILYVGCYKLAFLWNYIVDSL